MLFVFLQTNAQTIVFQDKYDETKAGVDLTTAGYTLSPKSMVATVQSKDAIGNNGSQFVKIAVDTQNSIAFGPAVKKLEPGKTYTFEVMTSAPVAKNRTPYILIGDQKPGAGGRKVGGDVVNAAEWTKSSKSFTLLPGETDVKFQVYSAEKTIDLYIDDFIVYEGKAKK